MKNVEWDVKNQIKKKNQKKNHVLIGTPSNLYLLLGTHPVCLSCRKLYPDRSPQVGIQLMKVGKLQLYLGELTAALKSLHQAQDILWITHGEKHTLCSELSSLKHQCEEEMRMQFDSGLLDNANTQCSR